MSHSGRGNTMTNDAKVHRILQKCKDIPHNQNRIWKWEKARGRAVEVGGDQVISKKRLT